MAYNDNPLGDELQSIRNLTTIAFANGAARVRGVLLPDSCKVRPATSGDYAVNAKGIGVQSTPAYRTYNTYEDIPCRADVIRAFRPDSIGQQETLVGELDMHFPLDFPIDAEDMVVYNGSDYKIRKLDANNAFDVTKVAKILKVGTPLDNP